MGHAEPPVSCGVIAGQFGLLAIWAVFGTAHWAARFPLTLLLAAWLCELLLLGMLLADVSNGLVRDFRRAILLVPLVFTALQMPLWIARLTPGCRLVFQPNSGEREPWHVGQFGVQHLLGVTTLLAILLGFTQAGVSVFTSADYGLAVVWTRLLIACAGAAAFGLLAVLPCVWATFGVRQRGLGAIAVAGYTIALGVLAPMVLVAHTPGATLESELFEISLWLHAGAMGTMLGGLHVVRACGYTMIRPGYKLPATDGSLRP